MTGKNDFVLDWDKALGFKSDPFADKIFEPVSDFMVDRAEEKEKLNWFFIKNYFYGTLIGEHGVGKTMLLKWLDDRLKKYNKLHPVYINAAIFKEQINIPHQILWPLLSLYERSITKPHKKLLNFDYYSFLKKKLGQKSVVLLIDNAQSLTEKNLELIKSMREEGLRLQIIMTATPSEFEKSRLQELGHDDLHIILRRLTYEESREMIMKRIRLFGGSGIRPFDEEILKDLFEKADKNPRQFLHLCRDEAIRQLIHQKDLESNPVKAMSAKTSSPLKRIFGQKSKSQIADKTNLIKQNSHHEKKNKLINIRFDFGKKGNDKLNRGHTQQSQEAVLDDRKAIYNEKHKQDLIDQLRSSSPRRNIQPHQPAAREYKRDQRQSEADRIMKELSEEFEGK